MEETVKLAVEAAARSLARCEQCRAGLERKLLQKEFEKDVIQQALDFLEEKGYLSDARYAEYWIRNHCTFKPQGRIRLLNELTSRGVSREVAKNAVESYFEKVDEVELCKIAYQKLVSKQKTEQKIIKSLADSGFSYKIVTKVITKNL
ncbi:MAG: regulatory protein RecX [Treponema sp.]|nr:regulatory protein RecX [Treponema sp.]